MKVGDLVRRIQTGSIGIVVKFVRISDEIYYWVHIAGTCGHKGSDEVLLHSTALEKI